MVARPIATGRNTCAITKYDWVARRVSKHDVYATSGTKYCQIRSVGGEIINEPRPSACLAEFLGPLNTGSILSAQRIDGFEAMPLSIAMASDPGLPPHYKG